MGGESVCDNISGLRTKVFIVKPSSLGDIVHTLPAVAWMKESRPDWDISWLVNTEWAPLLAGNPDVERAILFPRREFRGIHGLMPFVSWVRKEIGPLQPDIAVDFQGLLRTAVIARASKAKRMLGLSDAREGAGFFYHETSRVSVGTPHAVERYIALAAKTLGVDEAKTRDFGSLRYPLPAGTAPAGAERLSSGPYVLLHPFSRGEGKSLTVRQVERLCHGLAPQRQVVIAGRGGGGELLDLPSGCTSFLDRTALDGLIWLIRHASFVVSVDSGPMHLAAALNRPLVSIHTWSDPRKVGPYRPDAWVWKNGRLFRFAERLALSDGFYASPPSTIRDADLDEIAAVAETNAQR